MIAARHWLGKTQLMYSCIDREWEPPGTGTWSSRPAGEAAFKRSPPQCGALSKAPSQVVTRLGAVGRWRPHICGLGCPHLPTMPESPGDSVPMHRRGSGDRGYPNYLARPVTRKSLELDAGREMDSELHCFTTEGCPHSGKEAGELSTSSASSVLPALG